MILKDGVNYKVLEYYKYLYVSTPVKNEIKQNNKDTSK